MAGLPKDPRVPLLVRIWKGPLKWLGNFAMAAGILGAAATTSDSARRRLKRMGKGEPE